MTQDNPYPYLDTTESEIVENNPVSGHQKADSESNEEPMRVKPIEPNVIWTEASVRRPRDE